MPHTTVSNTIWMILRKKHASSRTAVFLLKFSLLKTRTIMITSIKSRSMQSSVDYSIILKSHGRREILSVTLGRKSKNTQDVMIFSKGKARNLRIDVKKTKETGEIHHMSGTTQMLPTMFDIPPVGKGDKIHQSELPLTLCEKILQFVTKQGEIVLDSFAGSGVVGGCRIKFETKLHPDRTCASEYC